MTLDSAGLARLRQRIAVFTGFEDHELVTLLRKAERRTLRDGELLFREGSPGMQMFVLLSGRVRIVRRLGLEQPEILATLDAGDCFGEMGLIDAAPRSADAVVEGETVVLELTRQGLESNEAPLGRKLYRNLASILSARLRAANEQVARLTAGEREGRARFRTLAARVGGGPVGLRGSDLAGSDLRGAELHDADLRGALLAGVDWRGVSLAEADLRGADLRQADFSGADLSHADLSGADLRGATLRQANLSNAQLAGARLLPLEQ